MKKLLSWLFVLVILTTAVTPTFANGESDYVYAGPNYKNLNLKPTDGTRISSDSFISWKASGTFYYKGIGGAVQNVIGWFSDSYSIHKVCMEVYKITETNMGYSKKEFYSTLFTKSYNDKSSVEFSESGSVRLSAGKYEFVLKVGHKGLGGISYEDKVKSSTITVYNSSSNSTVTQPKYATVTVIHKLVDDGRELRRENKQLAPGTHSLYADYPVGSSMEVYGSSSQRVSVNSNGVADVSTVVFQYKLLKKDNPQNNTTQTQPKPPSNSPAQSGNAYDIGIPNLNGNVYYENDMNVHVLWVHYQLKATGVYYQGDSWDETGNLGDRTMREIGKFMQDNGYRNHDGHVDQTVINTLANYLGSRRVPVYVGGFYEKMNTIMTGGSAGSMQDIDENSSAIKVMWVQICLKKLGYYNSSIDGKFGSGTIRALKNFQADCGYVQRDYVSLGVARAMLELCYHRGYNLNDLP